MMRTLNPDLDQTKRFYSPTFVQPIDKNKIIFGNHSRYAKNWIGGPNEGVTHQYIPGYTGHVKGRIAENIFASSFAKETSKAIGRKHSIGSRLQPKQRFQSEYGLQFRYKNFRRFGKQLSIELICLADNKEMRPKKDYEDYLKFIGEQHNEEMQTVINTTIENDEPQGTVSAKPALQTISATPLGFQSRNNKLDGMEKKVGAATIKLNKTSNNWRSGSVDPRAKMNQTLGAGFFDQRKASQIEKRLDTLDLSDGFKKILPIQPKDRKMVIPIAGYGGHRRGDRSQNFFGKPFRDTSIQSKKLQREFRAPNHFVGAQL